MTERIDRVLVIGAGTMGAGIAEVCAKAGLETTLSDTTQDFLDRGIAKIEGSLGKAVEKGKLGASEATLARGRIRLALELAAATDADLVIEAVPEDMALKKKIFAELARLTTRA